MEKSVVGPKLQQLENFLRIPESEESKNYISDLLEGETSRPEELFVQKFLNVEFWTGIRNKIPLCCVLFYESMWYPSVKNTIDDYAKTMVRLTDNQGIILCPNCLVKAIKNKRAKVLPIIQRRSA